MLDGEQISQEQKKLLRTSREFVNYIAPIRSTSPTMPTANAMANESAPSLPSRP
jgi:hypothetical protein